MLLTHNQNPAGMRRHRLLPLLGLVLLLPLLAACGGGGSAGTERGEIAWDQTPGAATETPPAEDLATPPLEGEGGAVEFPINLGPDELAKFQPNELGRIPILMYHAFTTNEAYLDEWTVTPDTFRQHLQWLYDHDFYITPLVDLINNEISVPPGKHPVVVTFDDASSGQFRLLRDSRDQFYPDPITAVGIMEEFFAAHPDFGRGALFAVVAANCFQYDDQVTSCEERLTWLASHGYEIANHTWWHQDLLDVSDQTFMEQVGDTKIWIDERVTGRANLSNVLVLPFGNFPSYDWQMDYLYDGFVWQGQTVQMSALVAVSGGPSASPSSGTWTRWEITRFNTDPESWDYWTGRMSSGDLSVFTSDGNPATVTIPDPIPEDVIAQYDPEWATSYGMKVIRYAPPVSTTLPAGNATALVDPNRQRATTRRKSPR
jgi:peptidoglycan/xylan/chitin deacetylase (PgdA/CDA1 family)